MKSITTKLVGSYNAAKGVVIRQVATTGKVDCKINLRLTDEQAVDLGIRLLYELVPETAVRRVREKIVVLLG